MKWYSVFESDTGILRSHGTSIADPLPAGLESSEHTKRWDQSHQWDQGARKWIAIPPVRRISSGEFLERLTPDERMLFYDLDNKPARTIDRALSTADRLGYIDLDDPRTAGLLDTMIAEGVIAANRKPEILNGT